MNKPEPQTKLYYDPDECAKYIEMKHGVKLCDFAGKFTIGPDGTRVNPDAPYQDFWHWIADHTGFAGNGSSFWMPLAGDYEPWAEDSLWIKQILEWFAEEFDVNHVEFNASW